MDSLNDAWTAWNETWGATVATIVAIIAVVLSLSEKIQRLTSAVLRWPVWTIILGFYRTNKNKYRLHLAKKAMHAKLDDTAITIPIGTYDSCRRQSPNTATRGQLESITPEQPPWLNDHSVATALEHLANEGKIVKAPLYDAMSFPPSRLSYLFQRRLTNKPVQEEANDIETNSKCAIYQSFDHCPMELRYERKGYAETIDPQTTRFGTKTWLKECALPCERCWDKASRAADIWGLVENITEHDLVETATREITGENREFQETVIKVCVDSKCAAEVGTVKEILKRAIDIRRHQLESVDPDFRFEWPAQLTEDFSARLNTYIYEENE